LRISAGESVTWLAIGFVFLAGLATLGGLFWMSRPTVDGVLDASWTAPTTNVDGSPLTDVVSYRVYYSTTNPPCPSGPFLTVPSSTARPAPDQKVT